MWDLPGPGLEPVSPALAGRFFFFGRRILNHRAIREAPSLLFLHPTSIYSALCRALIQQTQFLNKIIFFEVLSKKKKHTHNLKRMKSMLTWLSTPSLFTTLLCPFDEINRKISTTN